MSLLEYMETLLSILCTLRVRSSRLEEFYKKGLRESIQVQVSKLKAL